MRNMLDSMHNESVDNSVVSPQTHAVNVHAPASLRNMQVTDHEYSIALEFLQVLLQLTISCCTLSVAVPALHNLVLACHADMFIL